MNINISKQYKYVRYADLEQNITGPFEIIYSSDVNHQLLSMMFAKNTDDSVIIPNQMVYGTLTKDEVSLLSSISCMQLDLSNEFIKKYEFKSLLDTMMLTVIDIPEDIQYIKLTETIEDDDNGLVIDTEELGKCKKLFMLVQSPKTVENLSSEIHNQMMNPHYNTSGIILFEDDMNNYLNQDVINGLNNIQSNSSLGTKTDQYKVDIDTEYCKVIWDNVGNKYINLINGI